jgi:antitoxin VapB
MSMNIKSAEAHALAKDLAALENTTLTDAVILSLREALERRSEQRAAQRRLDRVQRTLDLMQERVRETSGTSLWEINEDLYDERGLPR